MVARDTLVAVSPRTVHQVLEESAAQWGDAPALRRTDGTTFSWRQYRDAAFEIAAGLRALGLGNGDVVALHSETRLEFYLADLGILANGSISAALYPTYPVADLLRSIAACSARAVFAEDPAAFHALRAGSPVPVVEHWILLTGKAPGAVSLDELRARGRVAIAAGAARAEVHPSDPAILYLTSGATGEPKMALVTHQAIVANLDMGPEALRLCPADTMIAFLPSAHIAQRIVVELLPMRCGAPVAFSESLIKLPQEIRSVRPTVLLAPPRMWERIYATICAEVRKRPAAARKLFYGALGMALAAQRYRHAGKPVPLRLRAPLGVADRLLFRKIRSRFGGRLRVAASGAAPLAKNLAEFYEAVGMPIVEGYGLTEGGIVTLNPLDQPRAGSIGKPLPGVEVRIADDGELLVRTPCLFSGYWRDPRATTEVVTDGWLHTGDIAYLDEGFVHITGRKTEVIVSSTGKKIFPARVEALFKTEPLISQVLLLGDRLPYLVALFTINPAVALGLPGMESWNGRPASELSGAAPVLAEIQKAVARANAQLATFEQVRKYRVLSRDFSIEEGELTATMKVRRARAIENFKTEIEGLYAGRD